MQTSHIGSIAALLITAAAARGQDSVMTAPGALYAEIGGRGAIYSVGYERFDTPRSGYSVGLAVYPGGAFQGTDLAVAMPLSYIVAASESSSRMIFDVGLTPIYVRDRDATLLLIPSLGLGYQYRPRGRGLTFKGELLGGYIGGILLPWAGISVGHSL